MAGERVEFQNFDSVKMNNVKFRNAYEFDPQVDVIPEPPESPRASTIGSPPQCQASQTTHHAPHHQTRPVLQVNASNSGFLTPNVISAMQAPRPRPLAHPREIARALNSSQWGEAGARTSLPAGFKRPRLLTRVHSRSALQQA